MAQIDFGSLLASIGEHPEILEGMRSFLGEKSPKEERDAAPASAPKAGDAGGGVGGKAESLKRRALIAGIKPYLSPRRAKAANTILLIADVLDGFSGKRDNNY